MAAMKHALQQSTNRESSSIRSHTHLADIDTYGYIRNIEDIKAVEYPALANTTYLDHAGTTPYAKSLVEAYAAELTSNLFGNPHSASASSQLSSRRVDDIRLQVLRFFHADPEHFDVVFTANATAAIKLVADAFRDASSGFWYGYHSDAHTSLVGIREYASMGSKCFRDDIEVDEWLSELSDTQSMDNGLCLYAYPGQSNMTGRRSSLVHCASIRAISKATDRPIYSLYDAAALLSTSPLYLHDPDIAPDFTALSFYKIFGLPDLGALIVRRASGDILRRRKYFGGGTVEMVSAYDDSWHIKKISLHSSLEDGTLPFHNIIALDHALKTHSKIYGSMDTVARHTNFLAGRLYESLQELKHGNGKSVCRIYSELRTSENNPGPVLTFNLLDSSGHWISNTEVEKLGIVKGIQFRTGGLCNPGGTAKHLSLTSDEMKQNFAAGQRCGGGNDILNGKPTGSIRVSLGATSSLADVERFISFLKEFYVHQPTSHAVSQSASNSRIPKYVVESLSVFPIKSCAAYQIPDATDWEVQPEGLAFDRQWCLIHEGTNVALSQKQYPRMALLQPTIDLKTRKMSVIYNHDIEDVRKISIDLDILPDTGVLMNTCKPQKSHSSTVCGEAVPVHIYKSPEISEFFSDALGTSCTLARRWHTDPPRLANIRRPKSESKSESLSSNTNPNTTVPTLRPQINLSNESPILLISTSSLNELNRQIAKPKPSSSPSSPPPSQQPKAVTPSSFRPNITISQPCTPLHSQTPYLEDEFLSLSIINAKSHGTFTSLGPCQRCQMVCVDQESGRRGMEPFSTLAKTRRRGGGVWFGVHLCLDGGGGRDEGSGVFVRVGDEVVPVVGGVGFGEEVT